MTILHIQFIFRLICFLSTYPFLMFAWWPHKPCLLWLIQWRVEFGYLGLWFVESTLALEQYLVRIFWYPLIPKSTNELLLGTSSALSLVMIGYDRYNIICKGLDAKHMTWGGAFLCILGIWIYCIVVSVPPFFGWGGYALGMSNTNQKMYLGNF